MGAERTVAAFATAALLLLCPATSQAQGMPGMPDAQSMMEWGTGSLILLDELEYMPSPAGHPVTLDAVAWYGGAYHRLWLRADAEQLTTSGDGEIEGQLLYGRLVSAYWDALAGIRVDRGWGEAAPARTLLTLGLMGLSPLRFEFAPSLFVSTAGHVSARLEAEYQLLLTQRVVIQPKLELNAALQEVPASGVGTGLNDLELGLRVRYEISRAFAPYVGVTWLRAFGGAADFARASDRDVSRAEVVLGVRAWR